MDPNDVDETNDRNAVIADNAHDSSFFSPIALPCGRVVPNRLVKVALYEHMASLFGGPPNICHLSLYSKWARGNWGMVMTGNVQVKTDHLSLGRDIVVPIVLTSETIQPFKDLASVIHGSISLGSSRSEGKDGGTNALAILQLSHSGRQSPNVLGGRWPFIRPLAPSPVALNMKPSGQALKTDSRSNSTPSLFSSLIQALMFQTPRAMTSSSIDDVISAFARGAELAARSGFDGVELHAGHGYLIAEFISEETNLRTDEFCATSDPLRFLRSIVSMIRSSRTVPADFAIGIKLNAADYIQRSSGQRFSTHSSDTDEERVLAHVREIATWRMVDFIEISGGNYENPEFMNHLPSSRREALFSRFSKRALQELLQFAELRPLVLLTGGLVTPELMSYALRHNHADLLGIGRLSVLYPELPKVLQWGGPSKNTVFSRCPLASGMKPWDTGEPKSQSSLVHAERTAMNLVRAVWQLVPRSIRPEFPNLIGAGVEMAWFSVVMRRLAKTSGYDAYDIGEGLGAVVRMWLYIAPPYPPTLWFAMIWGIGVILLGILFHL